MNNIEFQQIDELIQVAANARQHEYEQALEQIKLRMLAVKEQRILERQAQKAIKKEQEKLAKEQAKQQRLQERQMQTLERRLRRIELKTTLEGRIQIEKEKQAKRDRHEEIRQKGEHEWKTNYPDCMPIRLDNGQIAQPGTAVGMMVDICTQHHGPKPHVSTGRSVVRHKCANDSLARNGFICGNPDHIEWSTQKQNFHDALNGPHSHLECPHCGESMKYNTLGFHMYKRHPHLYKGARALPPTENAQEGDTNV